MAVAFLRDAPLQADLQKHETLLGPLGDVVRDRQTWAISLIGALVYMPTNVFGALWGNSELTADHGLSTVQAETTVSLLFWGMAAGSVAAGWLAGRLGHRKWILFGGALGAALAWCIVIYSSITAQWQLSLLLLAAGFFGGTQMLTFAMAKSGQAERTAGTVIAFVNMIGIGAALIFQPLVGLISDQTGGSFTTALSTIPASLLAACVLISFVREPPVRSS